jgi:long-chain acyl-CoA synthetase
MKVFDIAETIPGLLRTKAAENPQAVACFHSIAGKRWVGTTREELWKEAERVAGAFVRLGLKKGDRLAIMARTCREWQIAEMGGLTAGAVIVGIDGHAPSNQVADLMEHSRASCLVVDCVENLKKIPTRCRDQLRFIILLEKTSYPLSNPGDGQNTLWWGDLISQQSDGPTTWVGPAASDPATIIYTSGTTGMPKGIEYSHRQCLVSCEAMVEAFPHLGEKDSCLCWLPMAPLFQRLMNLMAIVVGAKTYFVEDPRTVMDCLRETRPSTFIGVPRFYEKLHEGIEKKFAGLPSWQERLIQASLAVGTKRTRCQQGGGESIDLVSFEARDHRPSLPEQDS